MERLQNRLLLTALRGRLVTVLAVAGLALAVPARAGSSALGSPEERTGPSVSGGQAALPQALHLVTTPPGTARLVPSGGSTPVLIPLVPALRPADGSGAPVTAPALPSRPPIRILFCTWLN